MKILSGTTQKALMLELGMLNHCIMEILPVLHEELSMRDYKQFKDMFTDSMSTLAVGIHGKLGTRLMADFTAASADYILDNVKKQMEAKLNEQGDPDRQPGE